MPALEEPLRQLAENAGLEGSLVVGEVNNRTPGIGLNIDTGEYVVPGPRPRQSWEARRVRIWPTGSAVASANPVPAQRWIRWTSPAEVAALRIGLVRWCTAG